MIQQDALNNYLENAPIFVEFVQLMLIYAPNLVKEFLPSVKYH